MTDFALGDIVVMKMGGPWMTVVRVGVGVTVANGQATQDNWCRCIWFDADHRLQRNDFEAYTLKPVELVA